MNCTLCLPDLLASTRPAGVSFLSSEVSGRLPLILLGHYPFTGALPPPPLGQEGGGQVALPVTGRERTSRESGGPARGRLPFQLSNAPSLGAGGGAQAPGPLPLSAAPGPHLQHVGGWDVHGLRASVVQVLHHHLRREGAPCERQADPRTWVLSGLHGRRSPPCARPCPPSLRGRTHTHPPTPGSYSLSVQLLEVSPEILPPSTGWLHSDPQDRPVSPEGKVLFADGKLRPGEGGGSMAQVTQVS